MSAFEVEDEGAAPRTLVQRESSSSSDSSDAEEQRAKEPDDRTPPPYPDCVMEMDEEVRKLLRLQFKGFRKHLVRAIERNMLDDLYSLKVLYQTQIYGPFLQGMPFKPIVKPAKIEEEEEEEGEEGERPAWIDKYLIPCQIAAGIIKQGWFQIAMVLAIVIAGLLVGAETYIACGYESCRGDAQITRTPCLVNATLDACEAAGCCFDSTEADAVYAAVLNATGNATAAEAAAVVNCFTRGPAPECWHGENAQLTLHTFEAINAVILIVFTAEVILKILSYKLKPWRYWMDGWNVFDFIIVGACYVPGGDQLAFLRLLRLMRLLKVLHFVKQLQIILKGLANGMESITYILLLLVLIFYLFAICSVLAFSENDPVHFGSLHIAMVSLFRMSTMEDWTDIMYINMYGCMKYGYLGASYCYDERYCPEPQEQMCESDVEKNSIAYTGHGMAVAVFFVIFIVVSGLVVMSLFIGVITTSMVEAADSERESSKEQKQKDARQACVDEIAEKMKKKNLQSSASRRNMAALETEIVTTVEQTSGCMGSYLALGAAIRKVIDTSAFANFIIGCILAAAAIIGAQTYKGLAARHENLFFVLDQFILIVFTLEVILKLIGLGKEWTRYFKEGWNLFDFFVVAMCFMPFGGSAVAVLRLLRLLRVLKLFNNIKELQIILSGLANGMSSVSYIGLLLFLLFYVFGIVALMFFRPNDPAHFPDLQGTMVTLFRCATMEDWTDVMYVSMYGCNMYHYGNDEDIVKCENSEAFGMTGAIYWIIFIMLANMVMLNLVVGVVCSAMTEATDNHSKGSMRETCLQNIVDETQVPRKIVDTWAAGFSRLDDAEGLGVGNIKREDLDIVLNLLGETKLLSRKGREHLYVRANHTLPLGMISLSDFVSVLARDLAKSKTKDLRTQLKLQQQQRRAAEINRLLASGSAEEDRESLTNELAALDAEIAKKIKKLHKVGMPVLPSTESRPSSPSQNEARTKTAGGSTEYEAAEDVFVNPLQKGLASPPENDSNSNSGDFT